MTSLPARIARLKRRQATRRPGYHDFRVGYLYAMWQRCAQSAVWPPPPAVLAEAKAYGPAARLRERRLDRPRRAYRAAVRLRVGPPYQAAEYARYGTPWRYRRLRVERGARRAYGRGPRTSAYRREAAAYVARVAGRPPGLPYRRPTGPMGDSAGRPGRAS